MPGKMGPMALAGAAAIPYTVTMKKSPLLLIFVGILGGSLCSGPSAWAQRGMAPKGLRSLKIRKKVSARMPKIPSQVSQRIRTGVDHAAAQARVKRLKQQEQKVLSRINDYRDLVVEMQKNMIAARAVSPHDGGPGEKAKVDYLMRLLKTMKFDELYVINIKDPKAPDGVRPNIIAKYYGQDTRRNLWVMAHTDVVPPGDLNLWKTDPFQAVVEGDKIYGRGAEDNHQGLISSVLAAKALMDAGVRPRYNYSLLINADEELGGEYGLIPLLRDYKHIFTPQDVFLVPDAGNAEGTMVQVAEKNMMWLKFTVHGKQAHASLPKSGTNAARASSYLMVQLDKALHKKFNRKDRLFSPESVSTFEPTKREAADAALNTIPGTDTFYLDCRILPCYTNEEVLAEIARVRQEVEAKFHVRVEVEVTLQETHLPTDRKNAFVQLVLKAVKEVYQNKPKVMGDSGSTVASFVRNEGFPAVVFSKLVDTAHQPNEYSSIANTLGDAKVFSLTMMRLE